MKVVRSQEKILKKMRENKSNSQRENSKEITKL